MSDTTDFSTDLQELYDLAGELVGNMEAVGAMILPTDPTIYAQCGKKPRFESYCKDTFAQLCASKGIDTHWSAL